MNLNECVGAYIVQTVWPSSFQSPPPPLSLTDKELSRAHPPGGTDPPPLLPNLENLARAWCLSFRAVVVKGGVFVTEDPPLSSSSTNSPDEARSTPPLLLPATSCPTSVESWRNPNFSPNQTNNFRSGIFRNQEIPFRRSTLTRKMWFTAVYLFLIVLLKPPLVSGGGTPTPTTSPIENLLNTTVCEAGYFGAPSYNNLGVSTPPISSRDDGLNACHLCPTGKYKEFKSSGSCESCPLDLPYSSIERDYCSTVLQCSGYTIPSDCECKKCSLWFAILTVFLSFLSFCFLTVYVNKHCSERHKMMEVKVLSGFYQISQVITLVNIEVRNEEKSDHFNLG